MVNLLDLVRRFLAYLRDLLLSIIAAYILVAASLLSILIDFIRAFWYECDYDNEDDEYVNPSLDILPLSDKFIESRERILQVYLVVFGLFVSNFYDSSLEVGAASEDDIFSPFYLKFYFVVFLCSALIYYVLLSKRITYLLRRLMSLLACVMGLLFGSMLLQMLGLSDQLDSFYSFALFIVVAFLVTFSLLI